MEKPAAEKKIAVAEVHHTFRTTPGGLPLYYGWFEAMHSRFDLLTAGLAEAEAGKAAEAAAAETLRLEKRLNRFDPQSDLWAVNHGQRRGSWHLDEELYALFEDTLRCKRLTEGAFDICIQTPGFEPGNDYYTLDPDNRVVVFRREGLLFDLGGYAKGYALEAVRKLLAEAGVTSALLSFGGSSVCAVGRHPLGKPWQAGMAHPLDPAITLGVFDLENTCLSSSGNAGTQHDGHIVDPATGESVMRRAVVSVCGPSAIACEVLSTALFVVPDEKRRREIAARFGITDVREFVYGDAG